MAEKQKQPSATGAHDPLPLPADPLVGHRLANFVIEGVLQRGGMAQVYYGLDVMLERKVAIKVINSRYRSDPIYAEQFLREARSVAAWHHPHIIQIHYADTQDGLYYFVMELVDGYDLGDLLQSYKVDGKLMPHQDVLQIGWAVAQALDFAHDKGVIHRDVKPSNVMIAKDGRILLMDFGLALATDEGSKGKLEIVGTAHYISPEQVQRSADAVPQSDLYSLGVMLYEMLAGVRPFDDPKPITLAWQHITQPPPSPREHNPALSIAVEEVLLKTLEKSPTQRYQSGQALLEALTEALAFGQPVPGGRVYLPPLPAGVQPDRMATSMSRLSSMTIAEIIASRDEEVAQSEETPALPDGAEEAEAELEPDTPAEAIADAASRRHEEPEADAETEAEPIPEPALVTAAAEADGWSPSWWVGAVGLLLMLLVVGAWGNRAGWFAAATDVIEPAAIIAEASATSRVTATASLPTVTLTATPDAAMTALAATETAVAAIPPTSVATDVATATATTTATPVPTDTTTATATATVTAATTETPTFIPTAEPSPTQDLTNNHRVRFFYDDYSFYIWNPEPVSLNVAAFSFEALDNSGEPAGYVFRGRTWADIYPFLEEGRCNRIRPVALPETPAPSVCSEFNASLTPGRDEDNLFWMPHDGLVNAFRVYWLGDVVGTCPRVTGVCEVLVPIP